MEKKRHILTVEVDEKTYETVMKIATDDDRSYGYVVRKILQNFCADPTVSHSGKLLGTRVKGM